MEVQRIIDELQAIGNPEKAKHLSRFFKTGKGEYGEGDLFIGVTVPESRGIAGRYRETPLMILHKLMTSPYHEARLVALLILLHHFEKYKKDRAAQQACVDFYINHTLYINNWDLVDLTCYKLLGVWLEDKDRQLLYDWTASEQLWRQRIAIVTCMQFVRKKDFNDALAIANLLLVHPHDLIQKAVGWILREVGKKDTQVLIDFLAPRYHRMPRTMLRYAIERFPEEERKKYLIKKTSL